MAKDGTIEYCPSCGKELATDLCPECFSHETESGPNGAFISFVLSISHFKIFNLKANVIAFLVLALFWAPLMFLDALSGGFLLMLSDPLLLAFIFLIFVSLIKEKHKNTGEKKASDLIIILAVICLVLSVIGLFMGGLFTVAIDFR
jgi:hypothetical protein